MFFQQFGQLILCSGFIWVEDIYKYKGTNLMLKLVQEIGAQQYPKLVKNTKTNVINNTRIENQTNNKILATPNAGLMKVYFSGIKHNISFSGTRTNYKDLGTDGYFPLVITPGMDLKKNGIGDPAFPGLVSEDADFSDGFIDHCYLKNSILKNANFTAVDMTKTHLHDSDLSGSEFIRVYAHDASFKHSNLSNSDLTDLDAQRANFQKTDFKNCNFERANLMQTNLMGADLRNSRNLDSAKFCEAIYDANTKFPESFDPVTNGMLKFEKDGDLTDSLLREAYVKSNDPSDPDDYSGMNFEDTKYNSSDPNDSKNLYRTRLSNLILWNSNFKNTDCRQMSLAGSSLRNCNFENANLAGADLHGTVCKGAKFNGERTNLQKANLINANLIDTDIADLPPNALEGALYINTDKFPVGFDPNEKGMKHVGQGANMSDYNFAGCSFREFDLGKREIVSLEKAQFKRSDLNLCDLSEMNMKEADFTEAYLKEAHLDKANCEGANFHNAKMLCTRLRGTNLKNANLCWAKMQGAIIDEKTNLTGAKYNDDTRFPNGFDPKQHNMVYIPTKMASGY